MVSRPIVAYHIAVIWGGKKIYIYLKCRVIIKLEACVCFFI